jgi:superfamily II DNA helicase RecQ
LIEQSHPNKEMIEQIWLWLRIEPLSIDDLQKKLDQLKLKQDPELMIKHLSSANVIKYDSQIQKYIALEAFRQESDIAKFQIDTEMISKHRVGEESRLNEMMNFTQHHGCKHGFLLHYFGEQQARECPKVRLQEQDLKCDHCVGKSLLDTSENSGCNEAEFVMIQKALSGVVRAEGRFGLVKVADMLIGSESTEIKKTSLVKLSTYGVLRELSKTACKDFLYWLMDQGFIQNQGQEYPTISITTLGLDVLFKRVPFQGAFPKDLISKKDRKVKKEDQQADFKQTQQKMGSFKDLAKNQPTSAVQGSWRSLTQTASTQSPLPTGSWRSFSNAKASPNLAKDQGSLPKASHQKPKFQAQAQVQGKEEAQDHYSLQAKLQQFALKYSKILGVPSMQILNQESISQIVSLLPKDQATLMTVSGFTPMKWARFGQELLSIVKQYIQETSIFGSEQYDQEDGMYDQGNMYEEHHQEQHHHVTQDLQSELRTKIKTFRSLKAKEDHVPAYVVFHDSVVEQLVLHRPTTKEDFLKIQGLGPAKWAKYGPSILEIIQEHL